MLKLDEKPLLIIDGYGFIFRAYHVQPPLVSPSGAPVGAIYGFTSMLLKLINDFKPDHAVIVLDHGGKNFRHEIFKDYKANRPAPPEDLVAQLKLVKTVADALNFRCLSKQGYEADDIIATLAAKASLIKKHAIIISADKDLMQLIGDYVKMYDPTKSKYIEETDILSKFGVGVSKIREAQALIGDTSDNVPGVAGIGPKTASQLINEYGTVLDIFNSLDKLSPRQRYLLTENKENALLSWKLVGLDNKVDIEQDIENFHWAPPSTDIISKFLNDNGFKSLNKRVENLFQVKLDSIQIQESDNQVLKNTIELVKVTSSDQLDSLINNAKQNGVLSIEIKKHDASLSIFVFDKIKMYEINYTMSYCKDLFSYSTEQSETIKIKEIINSILADRAIKKITYNLKKLLQSVDCEVNSAEDLMLMHYVLNAGNKIGELETVLNLDKSVHDSLVVYFLEYYNILWKDLTRQKLLHLYLSLDLPLCRILYDMEIAGIQIDSNYLSQLSIELEKKISILESKIFNISGENFNISSPKQLGLILFKKMELPFGKISSKTKTYSTNSDILEKLSLEDYEIAKLVLDYRHLTKLKNTYTDALPKQIDPKTGRIHTTFLQCTTTTGRLSSINPNVQNIPIRTDEGNKIRAAFITSENCKLISADYSQIELRILSYVANISALKQAFKENKDIHAITASQIFGIPLDDITPDIRRKAKAINFGIIYGISPFGLAKQLGITRKEASEYIEKYFIEYPGIQSYMSETIEFAKTNGFVKNLFGRKCFVPAVNSKDHSLRSFGERAAINAPMQSLAADIVKVAMTEVNKTLISHNMKTKMLLQIHDELIFEAPEQEVKVVIPLIKNVMENSCLLDIHLSVQVRFGQNWQELH